MVLRRRHAVTLHIGAGRWAVWAFTDRQDLEAPKSALMLGLARRPRRPCGGQGRFVLTIDTACPPNCKPLDPFAITFAVTADVGPSTSVLKNPW